jgi:hypothetical protein
MTIMKTPRKLSELIEQSIANLSTLPKTSHESEEQSENLDEIAFEESDKKESDRIFFHEIVEAFHERGFGMLLLILAAPMALPLPVPPGVNIILASPLIFLTAQQAIGRHTPWLPQFILQKQVKLSLFQKTMGGILPWIKKIEIISRARFGFITQGIFSYIIGLSGFLMALSVCVPLPLTNTVPSLGICLMAFGVFMRDGLAVLAGMLIGFSWIALLIIAGEAGIRYAVNLIM